MKQHRNARISPDQAPSWIPDPQAESGRHEMPRLLRGLLVVVLAVLTGLALLAAYASWQPVILTIDTPVLHQSRQLAAGYRVILKPNSLTDQLVLPMDQVYLDELTETVEIEYGVFLTMDRPVNLLAGWTIEAILRGRDAADGAVLLSRSEILLAESGIRADASRDWSASPTIRLDLDRYRQMAAAMTAGTTYPLLCDLALVFRVDSELQLPGGPVSAQDTATVIVPLNQPRFTVTRELPTAMDEANQIRQDIRYQVALDAIPFYFFLIAAALCLVSLLLLLLTTSSRLQERFWRRLRRMKRQARGRLMMLGDRAWDPAWCIRAVDFAALSRTARKLKHPVFCYVDAMAAWPVAYFYVYYGENNYCHIYTENPDGLDLPSAVGGPLREDDLADQDDEPDQPYHDFPVLPESDDLPQDGASPEIRLRRVAEKDQPDPDVKT